MRQVTVPGRGCAARDRDLRGVVRARTRLSGKVCVVTGASSGIGEATARALGARGAHVVLAARRKDRLRAVADDIGAAGGRATWFAVDVTRTEDLEALRDHLSARHGGCDVLVNNAGVPGASRFADLSVSRLRAITETNYLSVLVATRLFLTMLIDARGHVVNVASLAGRYALPGAAAYTASKHAVVALSESLVLDPSLEHVAVTAVCPGFVQTEGFPHSRPPGALTVSAADVARKIVDVLEQRRVGTVCLPSWTGPVAAIPALAPALSRAIVGAGARRYRGRVHSD